MVRLYADESEDETGKVLAIGGMIRLADDLDEFQQTWIARVMPCPSGRSATTIDPIGFKRNGQQNRRTIIQIRRPDATTYLCNFQKSVAMIQSA
jgi:hypothetical protein